MEKIVEPPYHLFICIYDLPYSNIYLKEKNFWATSIPTYIYIRFESLFRPQNCIMRNIWYVHDTKRFLRSPSVREKYPFIFIEIRFVWHRNRIRFGLKCIIISHQQHLWYYHKISINHRIGKVYLDVFSVLSWGFNFNLIFFLLLWEIINLYCYNNALYV